MSVHLLRVRPRDVAAGGLGLLVGGPAPHPLAAVWVGAVGRAVHLGVLGASHVVTVDHDGHLFTEEVSCDAVRAGGQPIPADHALPGYRFTSRTRWLPAGQFTRAAAALRARSAGSGTWICGQFPGGESALTVLAASPPAPPQPYHWRTWHLYPEAGEHGPGTVVETESWWTPA